MALARTGPFADEGGQVKGSRGQRQRGQRQRQLPGRSAATRVARPRARTKSWSQCSGKGREAKGSGIAAAAAGAGGGGAGAYGQSGRAGSREVASVCEDDQPLRLYTQAVVTSERLHGLMHICVYNYRGRACRERARQGHGGAPGEGLQRPASTCTPKWTDVIRYVYSLRAREPAACEPQVFAVAGTPGNNSRAASWTP